MAATIRKTKPDMAKSTEAKLIAAATKEFAKRGFEGTDTNRIARRAGFAPQTFYRWFQDKTEVFLVVYRAFEAQERNLVTKLVVRKGMTIGVLIEHHRRHKVFRRSLRRLAIEDVAVRRARAESRKRQIGDIKAALPASRKSAAEIAVMLLQLERLADAIVENEFKDLELDDRQARSALSSLRGQV